MLEHRITHDGQGRAGSSTALRPSGTGSKPLKFVGVIDETPFDPLTWSGLSAHFFSALRDLGALHSAISAQPPGAVRWWYRLRSFQPDRRRWRFRYTLHLGYYRQMTQVALQRVARVPPQAFDVLLQVGAWYDLTSVRGKPVVSYHDGNLAALLASPWGYPRIARRHIDAALEYERNLYSRIALIFPMSRWLASSFMRDNGVSPRRIFPVGAGINLSQVRPCLDKTYDAPRILFVGKNFERKGGPVLLEAFRRVRREVPDAELTLIGPSLAVPPPGVRCLGFLSKDRPGDLKRMLDEYERASILALPSFYEPFGVALVEGMAHRLPCVGTKICAIPEIIQEDETGFLVAPGDERALAGKLLELLKNPEMCASFGQQGFLRYEREYTWSSVARRIVEITQSEL